jgi:hypothetical protein
MAHQELIRYRWNFRNSVLQAHQVINGSTSGTDGSSGTQEHQVPWKALQVLQLMVHLALQVLQELMVHLAHRNFRN